MNDAINAFLKKQHSAAMTTLRADSTPHTVRIGVALVDGKIWSSGTQTRARTRFLRRDPRSTLFVFDNEWRWLTLECRVNILEGPDVPRQSLRLFEVMQAGMRISEGKLLWYGQERTIDEFLRLMVEEQRLIYEFEVVRSYGMYAETPGR
ncbi:MAG TPA: pyridoxamine 5'-phosphate oxidase family protein [Dehalococcoidia bacterium]|nr:pyridoxamine 5'-phosphate oxidase family protein [Dehalococcoidia bacterium]